MNVAGRPDRHTRQNNSRNQALSTTAVVILMGVSVSTATVERSLVQRNAASQVLYNLRFTMTTERMSG